VDYRSNFSNNQAYRMARTPDRPPARGNPPPPGRLRADARREATGPERILDHQRLACLAAVVEHGGVTKAARALHLASSTVSRQVSLLEQDCGVPLLVPEGRGVRPTPAALELARLLAAWRELQRGAFLRLRAGRSAPLRLGVVESLPKTSVRRILQPIWTGAARTTLLVREDRVEPLCEALATRELDCVLSDAPAPQGLASRLRQRLLAEGPVGLYAAPPLLRRVERDLPASLEGAPFLLPPARTPLRVALEAWLASKDLAVEVVGEFEDPALMKGLGCEGRGVYAAPDLVEEELRAQGSRRLCDLPGVLDRVWLCSPRHGEPHPALAALVPPDRRNS
jgi:LysR family transcriptional activator of nhaA